jgi:TIR domain
MKAEAINDVALDYDNDSKRALRDSLLTANILLGPTLTLDNRSPYPITAFVGILVRTRASISGGDVLDMLMRQEDLQRCLVDLYEIDHGVPYHYFAKIACATMDELDGATTAVAFASSGGIRFEGETLVVAQGSEQLPLVRKADVVSLMVAPDIGPIARRAQRVFENLGDSERVSFNSLADERQLASLRALVGLQSAIEGKVFDAPTQERIESAVSTFARESTRSDGGPNLTGAVIEITSMVEILAKTFLSRLAYSVCGKDAGRIQLELKLPTSKIRALSLGKVVQALRVASKSDVFASAHNHVPEEWIDRLDAFADERNSWAHGAAQGTDVQLVDQAFLAMREGITIAGWLAAEVQLIRDRRSARERGRPKDSDADTPALRLTPRVRGSDFSVFVSHAAVDGPIAERLAMGLQAVGYNSWYAEWELKAGDSIVTKIQAALSACDILIIALSRRSVTSSWVNRELNSVLMAQLSGQQVLVIPVLIETCEIPPLLSDTLHVDLRGDFEEGFLKILDAIRSHRNKIARLPLPSPDEDQPQAGPEPLRPTE